MANNILYQPQTQPLRAIIEIDGGELKVYPVAGTDLDEKVIRDALRFVREDLTQ